MSEAFVNGVRLYYEVRGKGEPLLLIHGLGSDMNTWSHSLNEWTDRYAVIHFENRGAGRSDKPAGEYSTEQMADDAVALLNFLQVPRVHVIGKSMGGMIAQILAAHHTERVASLVLACTVMRHDAYGEELLSLGRTIAMKAGLYETYRQAFLLSYSREYCMKNRQRLAEAEGLLKSVGNEEMLRGYLSQSLACEKHDSSALAARITAPCLVISGGQDGITTPEQGRALALRIPNARFMVIPNGGHGFWREFPEQVNPVVLRFLEENSFFPVQ